MNTPRQPPRQVPTLTEVVDEGPEDEQETVPAALAPPPPATVRPPLPPPAPVVPPRRPLSSGLVPAMVSEEQLAHRVLLDLQKQVEQMLEQRVRDTMEPILDRLADAVLVAMVNDTRDLLSATLQELVATAVSQELARHKALHGPQG